MRKGFLLRGGGCGMMGENGGVTMEYRLDKYGNALSVLGFGCLRFPQKNGKIDIEATRAQIATFLMRYDLLTSGAQS